MMAKQTRLPRIAVIIPTYGRVGGAENVAYQLCERLAKNRQFHFHVLAQKWIAPDSAVTFHKIPFWPFPRWFRPISFALWARKATRNGHYDLVHSHERVFEMDILSFHGIPHRSWVKAIRKKHMSLFDHATSLGGIPWHSKPAYPENPAGFRSGKNRRFWKPIPTVGTSFKSFIRVHLSAGFNRRLSITWERISGTVTD